jgi:hypothetical protein
MPTYVELQELYDNCSWSWTTLNGVYGHKLTSNHNGNSIFLPAAGYRRRGSLQDAGSGGSYLTSSLNVELPTGVYVLNLDSDHYGWNDFGGRCYGCPVRAIVR